jgi:hypothetical protein
MVRHVRAHIVVDASAARILDFSGYCLASWPCPIQESRDLWRAKPLACAYESSRLEMQCIVGRAVALDLSVQCNALAVTVDKLVGENEEMVACLNGQSRLLESATLPAVEGTGTARSLTQDGPSTAETAHAKALPPSNPILGGSIPAAGMARAPERKTRLSFWQYIAGEDMVA